MKNSLISLCTLVAFVSVNPTYADIDPSLEENMEEESATVHLQQPADLVQKQQEPAALLAGTIENDMDDDIDMSEPQGTQVGKASTDGAKAARKKQWQNIGLAIGAVAVAVTALVLVSNNAGHSPEHPADGANR